MKTLRNLLLLLLLCILVHSCQKEDLPANKDDNNDNPGNNNSGNNTADSTTKETLLLTLVNNVRQSGCTCGATVMPPVPVLTWNDLLEKAAFGHSQDMNKNNYFSHTGLNGSSPGDRITRAGYSWRAYGENIASGYTTEQSVMSGWLQSEGHCKNIMSANVKEMGVGRDGNYWTQVFGAR